MKYLVNFCAVLATYPQIQQFVWQTNPQNIQSTFNVSIVQSFQIIKKHTIKQYRSGYIRINIVYPVWQIRLMVSNFVPPS